LPAYFQDGDSLPEAASQAARIVSVPIYPALRDAQVERIENALRGTAAEMKEAA
jgi:dTDP-4-amino-4,6-dideoxygalactose transaminase